jgi:hypothetical protein
MKELIYVLSKEELICLNEYLNNNIDKLQPRALVVKVIIQQLINAYSNPLINAYSNPYDFINEIIYEIIDNAIDKIEENENMIQLLKERIAQRFKYVELLEFSKRESFFSSYKYRELIKELSKDLD